MTVLDRRPTLLGALFNLIFSYRPTVGANVFSAPGRPTVAGSINAYANGQSLTYTVVGQPVNGVLRVDPNGFFSYGLVKITV